MQQVKEMRRPIQEEFSFSEWDVSCFIWNENSSHLLTIMAKQITHQIAMNSVKPYYKF